MPPGLVMTFSNTDRGSLQLRVATLNSRVGNLVPVEKPDLPYAGGPERGDTLLRTARSHGLSGAAHFFGEPIGELFDDQLVECRHEDALRLSS